MFGIYVFFFHQLFLSVCLSVAIFECNVLLWREYSPCIFFFDPQSLPICRWYANRNVKSICCNVQLHNKLKKKKKCNEKLDSRKVNNHHEWETTSIPKACPKSNLFKVWWKIEFAYKITLMCLTCTWQGKFSLPHIAAIPFTLLFSFLLFLIYSDNAVDCYEPEPLFISNDKWNNSLEPSTIINQCNTVICHWINYVCVSKTNQGRTRCCRTDHIANIYFCIQIDRQQCTHRQFSDHYWTKLVQNEKLNGFRLTFCSVYTEL